MKIHKVKVTGSKVKIIYIYIHMGRDTAKVTSSLTIANEKWVVPVKILITNISWYSEEVRTWCAKSWSKNIAKKSNFELKKDLIDLLKLLDKMCKYEMDPSRIVEDTVQNHKQTDGRTKQNRDYQHIEDEWRIYAPVYLSSLVQIMAWHRSCWIIVNWTFVNIFQWKFNQNTVIFIEENARENVVCEMASILSRPQCVNKTNCYGCEYSLEMNIAIAISRTISVVVIFIPCKNSAWRKNSAIISLLCNCKYDSKYSV